MVQERHRLAGRPLRRDDDGSAIEGDVQRPLEVRPVDPNVACAEAFERGPARMPVAVPRSDRDERHRRHRRGEERIRRRRPAAVMSDLEHGDARQAPLDEDGVDVVLGVRFEQHAPVADLREEHDREIVHPAARIRRRAGDGTGVGPEDLEHHLVEPEAVSRVKPFGAEAARTERLDEGGVPGPLPGEPRLEHATDPVAAEDERQAGNVVLVRMGEHDEVEAMVPRRQPAIEHADEAIRVGAAVDQKAAALGGLDEDRVALADVEHREVRPRVGARSGDERDGEGGAGECEERPPQGTGDPAYVRVPARRRPAR